MSLVKKTVLLIMTMLSAFLALSENTPDATFGDADDIHLNPTTAAEYDRRGVALALQGRHSDAIADYTKAIELDPKFVTAYSHRGISLKEKHQYNEAVADYTKALEIDRNYRKAYHNRGVVFEELGKKDAAKADYAKYNSLAPNVEAKADDARYSMPAPNGGTQASALDHKQAGPDILQQILAGGFGIVLVITLVSGVLAYCGLRQSCPKCKRTWVAKVEKQITTGRHEHVETVPVETVHTNRRGETIGRSTRTEQRRYFLVHFDEHRFCKYCNHSWVVAKARRD